MPRELITIQVGQCGNQIGHRFWELALREHATHNPTGLFDEAMSRFLFAKLHLSSTLAFATPVPMTVLVLLLQLLQKRRQQKQPSQVALLCGK